MPFSTNPCQFRLVHQSLSPSIQTIPFPNEPTYFRVGRFRSVCSTYTADRKAIYTAEQSDTSYSAHRGCASFIKCSGQRKPRRKFKIQKELRNFESAKLTSIPLPQWKESSVSPGISGSGDEERDNDGNDTGRRVPDGERLGIGRRKRSGLSKTNGKHSANILSFAIASIPSEAKFVPAFHEPPKFDKAPGGVICIPCITKKARSIKKIRRAIYPSLSREFQEFQNAPDAIKSIPCVVKHFNSTEPRSLSQEPRGFQNAPDATKSIPCVVKQFDAIKSVPCVVKQIGSTEPRFLSQEFQSFQKGLDLIKSIPNVVKQFGSTKSRFLSRKSQGFQNAPEAIKTIPCVIKRFGNTKPQSLSQKPQKFQKAFDAIKSIPCVVERMRPRSLSQEPRGFQKASEAMKSMPCVVEQFGSTKPRSLSQKSQKFSTFFSAFKGLPCVSKKIELRDFSADSQVEYDEQYNIYCQDTIWIVDPVWAQQFHKINSIFSPKFRHLLPKDSSRSTFTSQGLLTRHFRSMLSIRQESSYQRMLLWSKWSREPKNKPWRSFLLETLLENPGDALVIIAESMAQKQTMFPTYAIRDSLDHIACCFLLNVAEPNARHIDDIIRVTCTFLNIYERPLGTVSSLLSHRTMFLLLQYCNSDQLCALTNSLRFGYSSLSLRTQLSLTHHLIGFGEIALAFDVVRHVRESNYDSAYVQHSLALLLRARWKVDNIYHFRSKILEEILEMGIRPNRKLTNVIIMNAMEADDRETAWHTYHTSTENGLKSDSTTFSALLQGYHNGDNEEVINEIYQIAMTDHVLTSSPHLMFEFLHAVYLSEKSQNTVPNFSPLLRMYQKMLCEEPLRTLGIVKYDPRTNIPRISPTTATLGFMVSAWLEQCQNIDEIKEVYSRYIQNVRNRHPSIALLAETTQTANAFIKAFGRNFRGLDSCVSVATDMVELASMTDSTISEQTNRFALIERKFTVAAPNIYTWNVLLHSLMCHHQVAAAEHIMRLLELKHLQPDRVTWTSLIRGYSYTQNIDGVMGTLQRMETEGFGIDDWTQRALIPFHDKKGLIKALESAAEEKLHAEELERLKTVD